MKKYELTNETMKFSGHTLHRIKALRDFGKVKKGDLGGWIENEGNLSHEGKCWVADDAHIFGSAEVSGNAQVFESALVYGDARVFESAWVRGDAQVSGSARVSGSAEVYGDARVFGSTEVSDNAQVFGSAEVYGDAQVFGSALVYDDAQVSESTKENPKILEGIDDGGERISYGEDKAIREPSSRKGRFDLITPFGLARLAHWYELGAMKYSDRNWEKGIPFSRYLDSAMRHLNKFVMGMDDEDHLAAAAWNILAIIHHQEMGQLELDDMPHYKRKDDSVEKYFPSN